MKRWRQIVLIGLLRIFIAGLVTYLMVCMLVGAFQRTLLYHPHPLSPDCVDALAQSAGLERWRNAAGEPMGMKRLSPKQPSTGQVLVIYGNGGSAISDGHYATEIQEFSAFDVYILEYPGYEDRPGKPTEKSLFDAADEGLALLDTNKPIYLLGESLGSGVAAYLAGTHPNQIDGVVLFAPYNRLVEAAQFHYPLLPVHLLLLDRFPSEDYLKNYHGPVGILIGGHDQVVPERLGQQLYDDYPGPKKLWVFPQDGHGDVFNRLPEIWNGLLGLWQASVPSPPTSLP